ncbi:hypothetical protein FOB63_005388 [Clavispora lusitaniae]|uniref:uncharacterized protein n=1 Tax=Clavispora lusitaniae TaxID=36911 RepID=UPI00202C0970|nr:hypothetical protein FOB63_005388 [Clavispora lusitaniae]
MGYVFILPQLSRRSFHTSKGMRSDFANSRFADTSKQALLSPWFRHHLFILGFDYIKLQAYKKLSSLIFQGGGGIIKNTVFEISSFVKREWATNSSLLQQVVPLMTIDPAINSSNFKWFYVSIGYMMLTEEEASIESLTDKVVELYLESGGSHLPLNAPSNSIENRVRKITKRYYNAVKIDYRKLYDPLYGDRCIRMGNDTELIMLPPLPQIKSKQLLAKALLHKELYRAFESPDHCVYQSLVHYGLSVSPSILKIVKYDLSFLDGLGDFFLAKESSEFLYLFRQKYPFSDDDSFGKKTYNLLKTILATNTLLSRLAIAYNLHSSLNDPLVSDLFYSSYISTILKRTENPDPMLVRYEEEFVADYFEQYVGALYLEQPQVAKEWINSLFERILSSITDSYRVQSRRKKRASCHYDYRAWSVDMIGRSI